MAALSFHVLRALFFLPPVFFLPLLISLPVFCLPPVFFLPLLITSPVFCPPPAFFLPLLISSPVFCPPPIFFLPRLIFSPGSFPPRLLPLLFVGAEMFAPVVFLLAAVNRVLFITIVAKPFYLVLAKSRREIPVAYDNPWSLAVMCPVPVAVTVEVVFFPHIKKIIGQTHGHVKAKGSR